MQKILEEDIKNFALTFKLAERLIGKKIFGNRSYRFDWFYTCKMLTIT